MLTQDLIRLLYLKKMKDLYTKINKWNGNLYSHIAQLK